MEEPMWTKVLRIPASSTVTAPDAVVVLWAVLWIALGLGVVQSTRSVAELGGTVSQTGSAVSQVGGVINDIPLLPDDVSGASQSVQEAGASAEVNGADAQDAADRLAIYLGVAIAIIPSVPIIGLYLPIRIGRIRERRAAQRSLSLHGADPRFQEFLARRAVEKLPYEDLMAVSAHPWDDMKQGRFTALAAAELHRLEIYQPLPQAATQSR
jgi:hypothetical protein